MLQKRFFFKGAEHFHSSPPIRRGKRARVGDELPGLYQRVKYRSVTPGIVAMEARASETPDAMIPAVGVAKEPRLRFSFRNAATSRASRGAELSKVGANHVFAVELYNF